MKIDKRNLEDISGKIFNNWEVIKRTSNGYWLCKCKCGTIKEVRKGDLLQGKSKSCGCKNFNPLKQINSKFGRLIIIEILKNNYVKCRCDCGNIKNICFSSLQNNLTKSCGCLNKELVSKRNSFNLIGREFGKLIVIEKTNKKRGYSSYWLCNCKCGNQCEVTTAELLTGDTKSCGCLKNSYGEYKINEILLNNNILFKKEFIFNTLPNRRYDFAIIENNKVIRLIEFDGIQHYDINNIFYSKELIQRDREKNLFAISNNIPLVRIPYTEKDNLTLNLLMANTYLVEEDEDE